MTEKINSESLLQRATRFYLGRFKIDTAIKVSPVYIEREGKGWVVRAQLAELNPWYLNDKLMDHGTMKSFWAYKCGVAFTSPENALEQFNLAMQSAE